MGATSFLKEPSLMVLKTLFLLNSMFTLFIWHEHNCMMGILFPALLDIAQFQPCYTCLFSLLFPALLDINEFQPCHTCLFYVLIPVLLDIAHFQSCQYIPFFLSFHRLLDLRPRGRGFEPHRRHCIVSLRKNIKPSLVLVHPGRPVP